MTNSTVLKFLIILIGTAAARDILENQWDYTTSAMFKRPRGFVESCRDISYSGQVTFQVDNYAFDGVCVQRHRQFDDGWIVIQQRVDRNEDFYRNWADYREGFGSLKKGFWIGLEKIHRLTTAAPHELAVEVVSNDGKYYYARYSMFSVGSELERYVLKEVGYFSGSLDGLSEHVGKQFTTFDEDNDPNDDKNCAVATEAAWWFTTNCGGSNLNGFYNAYSSRILWHMYVHSPIKYSRMMIRKVFN